MKYLIIIAYLCCTYLSSVAQTCGSEYNIFSSQQSIEDFLIDNPTCTHIEGNVIIFGGNLFTPCNH